MSCIGNERRLSFVFWAGTNDAYVTIDMGKEKFQSAVKEKSLNPEWNEECEMLVYHRFTRACM